MKKLVAIIVVVALAAPLYAQQVTLTASDEGNGVLGISLKAGPSDPNVPVGISFIVTLTGAGANIGDPSTATVSTDALYNVFIDAAFDIGPTYTVGAGFPLADKDGPGGPAADVSVFAVSMGRLDPTPHDPVDILLLEIQLQGDGTTTVDFSDDLLRGTFVGSGSAIVLDDIDYVGTTVVIPPSGCVFPTCWNFPTQCHGDYDGNTGKTLSDFFVLADAFDTDKAIDPEGTAPGEYNPCSDYDRNGTVGLADFFILAGTTDPFPFDTVGLPADCPTGDLNNVFCP